MPPPPPRPPTERREMARPQAQPQPPVPPPGEWQPPPPEMAEEWAALAAAATAEATRVLRHGPRDFFGALGLEAAEGTLASATRRSMEAHKRLESVLDEGEPWLASREAREQVAEARSRARRARAAIALITAADRALAGGRHDHCGALGLDGSVWEVSEAARRQQVRSGRDAALCGLGASAYAAARGQRHGDARHV